MNNVETSWNISELETFFASVNLPDTVILSQCETIVDVPKFISTHLSAVKANEGKDTFIPYLERLNKLKVILSK